MPGISTSFSDYFFKSVSKYSLSKKAKENEELKKPTYCNPGFFKDENGQILQYPLKANEKTIKHFSSTANSVAAYSAKVLSTTVYDLLHDFNKVTHDDVEEHFEYARRFVEYCCFKAFSVLTLYEDHLHDVNFRRYTFDCMVAWEAPATGPTCLQEHHYESRAKEAEDEDASIFYTDLMPMLANTQDSFGIDAFFRIAPYLTIIADTVSAVFQFETLTASTSGRMLFPVYEKYLIALQKSVKEVKARQKYISIGNLPVSEEEIVLDVDGMSQTVIKRSGSKAVSGRLTLTDYTLYFEESSIISYHDAVKFNLAADLNHEVMRDLSGPWGSRIFDKAIAYRNSSLEIPVLFEFPGLTGSTRRDYWLALIQEVIDCHKFIRNYHLDELCKPEAIARAILGIIRLQAMRDCLYVLPINSGALLTYNSAEDFLPLGDLVLEALGKVIQNGTTFAPEEAKCAVHESDDIVDSPNSAVKLLQCICVSRDSKHSAVVYKVKPGELTPLERAMNETRKILKQTQKVKALEEEMKLDGVDTNVAVMKELLKPVVAFVLWAWGVTSWNRPLETFHIAVILAYVIFKDWLGYLVPFSLIAAAGILVVRHWASKKATDYPEIVVQMAPGLSLDEAVMAQRVISQLQAVLQATNVFLMKIWALALFVKPEVTKLLILAFFGLSLIMVMIPFRFWMLAIHLAIFTPTFKKRSSRTKIHRRLFELWSSIPPLPVRLTEPKDGKD